MSQFDQPQKPMDNGFAAPDMEQGASADVMRGVKGKGVTSDNLITVEPLKRSEMQPSYAQELPIEDVQGFYGSMINCLGSIAGNLGSVPGCFCCPNPYKEVK